MLKAVFFALQSLYSDVKDKHIEIQCDNDSCVKYIRDLGGITSLDMDYLASDIWHWCISCNIFISAVHIHVAGVSLDADLFFFFEHRKKGICAAF